MSLTAMQLHFCCLLTRLCCRYGVPEPYEKLKDFTRGQAVTRSSMQAFVEALEGIPGHAKQALQAMTPASYVGNAAEQAQQLRTHLAQLRD